VYHWLLQSADGVHRNFLRHACQCGAHPAMQQLAVRGTLWIGVHLRLESAINEMDLSDGEHGYGEESEDGFKLHQSDADAEQERAEEEEEQEPLQEQVPETAARTPKVLSRKQQQKQLNSELSKLSAEPKPAGIASACQILSREQDLLQMSSTAYIRTLMMHIERLAVAAVTSRSAVQDFINILKIVEGLPQSLLPVGLFTTILQLEEPRRPALHTAGRKFKRLRKTAAAALNDSDDANGLRSRHFAERMQQDSSDDDQLTNMIQQQQQALSTPLQKLRQYLCLDLENDQVATSERCSHKAAVTSMLYALLGLWESSFELGKQAFQLHVLQQHHERRTAAVELTLDVLFQGIRTVQPARAHCTGSLLVAS
jgi:hypothetical protein